MARSWRSAPILCLIASVIGCVFEAGAKAEQSAVSLKRHRREWIVPPQILEENVDYTKQSFIARIRSDKEDASKGPIRYSLRGVGADQPPYHLFVVEPNTGNVRITGILDREQISQYNLSGVATYPDGTVAENDIQLRIKVKDQNDNAPIFSTISPGSVNELSPVGTTVMKLVANDADEPGTPNSQIFYEIIDQKPPGSSMFSINQNGEVIVMNENLDRESVDQYVLTVRASDLNGAAGCNSGTSTCIIRVQDVNDNVPVLEQDSFEASVEENTENVEVMRFKATDMDMQNTDNWQAEYNIVSGNGGGHFKIVTDPKTNEGVLMLVKAVDYEEVKDMNLGITVNNKAPYYAGGAGGGSAGVGIGTGIGTGIGMGMGTGMGMGMGATGMTGGGSGGASGKIYNMHVNVKNQPEGPSFIPKVKAIPISENGQGVDIKKVLTTYTATDSDTGMPAKGVKYVKGSDRDNWLSIDETTGEIKLNKVPDRESPYLVNGTYMAEILCISQDMPGKTATGTVAIQVEDFNDHCPVLKNHTQTMCTTQEVLYVTAEDKDDFPNAGPFTFIVIPEESDGKWSVEHLNDTTAMLKPQDSPWPGPQKVTLEVRDQQGESCPEKQVLKLDVCTCDNSGTCAAIRSDLKSSVLGSAGIGLLLLGLLMLLLIPLLLLFCKCGTGALTLDDFSKMPFDTKEHLISYNTEGQGEDRDVNMMMTDTDGAGMNSTIHIPSKGSYIGTIGGAAFGAGGGAGYTISTINGRGYAPDVAYMDQGIGIGNRGSNAIMMDEFTTYDTGMALGEGFLNHYYTNKSQELVTTTEDHPNSFGFEGRGSPAGSVGCCSDLAGDNDLEFLNNLGPKFTTLAEICGGTVFTTAAPTPPPPKPLIDHSESISTHTNISNTVNIAAEVEAPSSMRTTEENMVVTNTHVVSDMNPVQTLINVPTQTLMMQQQPMYYMVEPQVSNTVLLAERPAMGLTQGMYVLNSAPVTDRVLVQGGVAAQGTIGGGDRVVLLETHGGSTTALNTGMLQSANLSGSQLFMVDAGAQAGQVLQGTLQRGGISGSQGVLLMEGQGGASFPGSLQRSVPVPGGSQSMLHVVERQGGTSGITSGSLHGGAITMNTPSIHEIRTPLSGTIGLNTMPGPPGSRKVVVQEKKVVKTNM